MPPPFKGYHGVTQGDPLSLTIFNILVDSVIRHWVMVAAPAEAGMEGLSTSMQELAAYFYADERLVAFPRLERLQRSFDVLTDLFNRIGLQMNVRNTISMACRPCHTSGGMLESA